LPMTSSKASRIPWRRNSVIRSMISWRSISLPA
jgi:hypothetical protein